MSVKKFNTGIGSLIAIGLIIVACVWCRYSSSSKTDIRTGSDISTSDSSRFNAEKDLANTIRALTPSSKTGDPTRDAAPYSGISPTETQPSSSATVPTLSAKESLEKGKKALSQGDLSTARNHLSSVPKSAPEYTTAAKLIREIEDRWKCSNIESELASVESDQAANEKALDLYEGMEGSIGKGSYLNALKEKGKLQLQHIALERKLKACNKNK